MIKIGDSAIAIPIGEASFDIWEIDNVNSFDVATLNNPEQYIIGMSDYGPVVTIEDYIVSTYIRTGE